MSHLRRTKLNRNLRRIWPARLPIALAICSIAAGARGQCADQTHKLLAADGRSQDAFGYAVAVWGEIAVSGAPQDDDRGSKTGAAYLFNTTTGEQIAKLVATDGAADDQAGTRVGISSSAAIVGAYCDDDRGPCSGSAYLFSIETGEQLHKLVPNNGISGDAFGYAVAISGNTAIIGADTDVHGEHSGSAYLFAVDSGTQIAELTADDGEPWDYFGYTSVAIDGPLAAVGAWGDDDRGNGAGAVYVFDVPTGAQIVKLLPEPGTDGGGFGHSVAIRGTTVLVGAWLQGEQVGAAYLFDGITGEQLAKLTADDGAPGDRFGCSVALGDSFAMVGAHGDRDHGASTGAVYLFERSSGVQVAKIVADDAAQGDEFGGAVAMDGTVAVVGAYLDDDLGGGSGAAYVIETDAPCADLGIDPDPLLAGQNATFTVTGAAPNTATYLAYSLSGPGQVYLSPLYITLDLASPKQAGPMVTSDASGSASWTLAIPPEAAGATLWLQACQFQGKTARVETVVAGN